MAAMKSCSVRVPATTANLGPGFDCLGVALRISNTVTVRKGPPAEEPGEMAREAAAAFFEAAHSDPFEFGWSVEGEVPRSRGLGSSVTVRLGILHALNEIAGEPLGRRSLFQICAQLEGHPDNAAPAAFGGFTVAAPSGTFQRYKVDRDLSFVLLIPPFEMKTEDARRVLPSSVSLKDAVWNTAHAASIAAAFASKDYDSLRGCFEDRLHQPYREPLLPCLGPVLTAGVDAGALGGWLSGSGSTIACVTLEKPKRVAAAMLEASGLEGASVHITHADNSGVDILG